MTAEPIEYELPLESALGRFPHVALTAEQYDELPEYVCRDIEVVDGMVVMSPKPTPLHQDVASTLRHALNLAGRPSWRATVDVDLRLSDLPLHNRQPDVVVYRVEAPRDRALRAADVLLVAEIVSPGSETVDRKIKPVVYAEAGIEHYWRVELKDTVPVVYAYMLDEATRTYSAVGTYVGKVDATLPFPVTVDLTDV